MSLRASPAPRSECRGSRRPSVANPWIEQRVDHVDRQVDHDVDEREQQNHGLYRRIVARQHCVDCQPAETRDRENAFGDDNAADQERNTEPDHGDDRNRRIAQRVAEQHLAFALSLRSRRTDVVLGQHFKHAGAGHSRNQRNKNDRQRQRGQNQPSQPAAQPFRNPLIALYGQPAQPDREQVDQEIADDEGRHRKPEHRKAHYNAIDPRAVPVRRQHAERNGHQNCQQHRDQGQRKRRLDALADQRGDGLLEEEALAEIAAQHLAGPDEELLHHRPVEAELAAVLRHLFGGGAIAGDSATTEQVAKIRGQLGLDRPMVEQFFIWSSKVLSGDFGESFFFKKTVASLIGERIEPTLSLALITMLLAVLVAVPLGVLAAHRHGSWIDRIVMGFSVLGFSMPSFVIGYLLIYLFAVWLGWLPVQGYQRISEGLGGWLRGLVLPSLTLSIIFVALIARMTRTSMLEVLSEDYIRTARAKGQSERKVLFRHALRNAAVPIVTVIGLGVALLIGGVVVTESVFTIPGLGRLTVDAVLARDYPTIQAVILLFSFVYVMINLAVDMLYTVLDPRIRY